MSVATIHTHDGDGAPASLLDPALLGVDVRDSRSSTAVDTIELRDLELRLETARRAMLQTQANLEHLADEVFHWHVDGPQWGAQAVGAADATMFGPRGTVQLADDIENLRSAVARAAFVYEAAEEQAGGGWIVPGIQLGRIAPKLTPLILAAAGGRTYLTHFHDADLPFAMGIEGVLREESVALSALGPWWIPVIHPGADHPVELVAAGPALATVLLSQAVRRASGATARPSTAPAYTVPPVRDLGDAMRVLQTVHGNEVEEEGTIGIMEAVHPDGRRTWTVLIPGTQSLGIVGANPLDMGSNLQAFSGLPTDMSIGVLDAMERAGIPRGAEVALVGHSQGGIIATRLASDPAIQENYRLSTVLSAGSPVGNMPVPDGVDAIALEHAEDVIVALDATTAAEDPNRVVVTRHTSLDPRAGEMGDGWFARTHGLDGYARTGDLLTEVDDPRLAGMTATLIDIMGADQAEVTVTPYVLERN